MIDAPSAPEVPLSHQGGASSTHFQADAFLPESLKTDFPGTLIVLEGPDGSGRSTHKRLLAEWLEWQGFAVTLVGLKRSKLLGSDLQELAKSNELQHRTRVLLYATDFYDQIENRIIPSLQAGFIVLADRYTLTLRCRALLRGMGDDYLDNLYRYVPEPDLGIRLTSSPRTAFRRIFSMKPALNHTEFGGDLNLAENLFESFIRYQSQLHHSMEDLGDRLGYLSVDSEQPVADVNRELREAIARRLGLESTRYTPSQALRHLWTQQ